jgi:hypothetical protein
VEFINLRNDGNNLPFLSPFAILALASVIMPEIFFSICSSLQKYKQNQSVGHHHHNHHRGKTTFFLCSKIPSVRVDPRPPGLKFEYGNST